MIHFHQKGRLEIQYHLTPPPLLDFICQKLKIIISDYFKPYHPLESVFNSLTIDFRSTFVVSPRNNFHHRPVDG